MLRMQHQAHAIDEEPYPRDNVLAVHGMMLVLIERQAAIKKLPVIALCTSTVRQIEQGCHHDPGRYGCRPSYAHKALLLPHRNHLCWAGRINVAQLMICQRVLPQHCRSGAQTAHPVCCSADDQGQALKFKQVRGGGGWWRARMRLMMEAMTRLGANEAELVDFGKGSGDTLPAANILGGALRLPGAAPTRTSWAARGTPAKTRAVRVDLYYNHV